ncbi:filamentous hemagglutinin N-terminal domain-containing protein [Acaryochloris sp. 'Moss Beach']|uniref:two-partner secretion domain-containing protein n=1 Tax=Acaryochloris sp. 'Moss Beach' TaxID=2740837 RepID=UPI0037BE61BD
MTQGVNLFHEFREFNLNRNNSVSFINPSSIDNIVATIQSSSSSRIDSLIGVEGAANLFFT